MNIPLHTAVAALALVWGSILFASAAFAQPTAQQRRLALVAHDEATANKTVRPLRVPADPAARAKFLQSRFDALCTFAPVMSDAAIEGCRQAHKL